MMALMTIAAVTVNAQNIQAHYDFWRGEKADGHGQMVILTEPQFWYNVTPHLSFGSEIEISNNFIYNTYNDKSFFVNPTIAAKWNF